MMLKNLITYKDKRFKVLRTIKEELKPIVETWKEHLKADTVLKKNGMYFFCEEIPDADVIAEWDKEKEEWININKNEE